MGMKLVLFAHHWKDGILERLVFAFETDLPWNDG